MGKFDDRFMEADEVCTCWREGHDGVRVDCDVHRHEVDDEDGDLK